MHIKISIMLSSLGILLVICGFLYELRFAGIPYQDPPLELATQYDRHARLTSQLKWMGVAVIAAGLVARLNKK